MALDVQFGQPAKPLTRLDRRNDFYIAPMLTQITAQPQQEGFHPSAMHGVRHECYARLRRHVVG
jgi:hypothetical protein